MAKRNASELPGQTLKQINSSTDCVYYHPAPYTKTRRVSAINIGKRPIYRFFIDYDGKYFAIRYMLHSGGTSYVISPEPAKAFAIPVVKRPWPLKSGDVS